MIFIATMHHYISSQYWSTHIKTIKSADVATGITNGCTEFA
jgi:hypothetical protein